MNAATYATEQRNITGVSAHALTKYMHAGVSTTVLTHLPREVYCSFCDFDTHETKLNLLDGFLNTYTFDDVSNHFHRMLPYIRVMHGKLT